jgi:hypothetical protein
MYYIYIILIWDFQLFCQSFPGLLKINTTLDPWRANGVCPWSALAAQLRVFSAAERCLVGNAMSFQKKNGDLIYLMSTGYVFPKKKTWRFWSPLLCAFCSTFQPHHFRSSAQMAPIWGLRRSQRSVFFFAHEDPWTIDISIDLYQWIISIIINSPYIPYIHITNQIYHDLSIIHIWYI